MPGFLKVWRHKIGTDPSQDVLVFHETDDSFRVGVDLSRDEKWIYISSSETELAPGSTCNKSLSA